MTCNCSITTWAYMPNKKIEKFKNKKKAGGILKHRNRLLLVQSRGNMWGFPKGSIEFNESVLDCALREVREETSLFIPFTNDNKKYYVNDIVFFYKKLETTPLIDYEKIKKIKNNDCSGIAWIDLKCLETIGLYNRAHRLLTDPLTGTAEGGRDPCVLRTPPSSAGSGASSQEYRLELPHQGFVDQVLPVGHDIKINSSLKKFIRINLKYLNTIE